MFFISSERFFSFLTYLNFCLNFSGHVENGLIRKLMLVSKFLALQTGKQMIKIHILPNTSTSKGNQAMKFG